VVTYVITPPAGYTNISEQFYLPQSLGTSLPGFSGGWNPIPPSLCSAVGGGVYACTFPLNPPGGAQFGTFAIPPGVAFGFLISGTPPAGVTALPSSLSFTATGQTQSVSVNEAGYGGTFTATSSNAAVAAVAPASGIANGASVTITAGSSSGTATITLTDSANNSATVSVTNTLTQIQVTGKVHR
jgi:hypothetical protein